MRYDAGIDSRNQDTSRSLIALVGRDRRVLDLACGGGELGAALRRNGCWVAGVEADPKAAEAAEPTLDEVVNADPAELDLVNRFGKASFDAVVLHDLLQRVVDPVALLRKVGLLLDEGGAVVASVPNVAHGSVRLALLAGRFDDAPPDRPPLRFFTHGALHQLLRDAGFVPMEVRRTTAGLFETDADLRREDFDPVVVDAVEGDPESTTHHFVVRAVPEDSALALEATPVPRPDASARCRVGLWWSGRTDDMGAALAARITAAELDRRLPGAFVRSMAWGAGNGPGPHDGGMALESLGPWSPARARELASELDCVVVVGDVPAGGSPDARFLTEGLEQASGADCPILWSAVTPSPAARQLLGDAVTTPAHVAFVGDGTGADADAVPDPLVLACRLLAAPARRRRLELGRLVGWFPATGAPVVLEPAAVPLAGAAALAAALDASAGEAGVVLLPGGDDDGVRAADALAEALTTAVRRVPEGAPADDVVAVVGGASAVVACSAVVASLALSFERPLAVLAPGGAGSLAAVDASALAGGAGALPARDVAPLIEALDAHFDRVAAVAEAAAADRPASVDGGLPPAEYVAALRLAHRRLQERLDGERAALVAHLDELRAAHRADIERLEAEVLRLRVGVATRQALDDAGAESAQLRRSLAEATAELEALRNIRVLRVLRPARSLYARLRRLR